MHSEKDPRGGIGGLIAAAGLALGFSDPKPVPRKKQRSHKRKDQARKRARNRIAKASRKRNGGGR